jgi:hypothetical protein
MNPISMTECHFKYRYILCFIGLALLSGQSVSNTTQVAFLPQGYNLTALSLYGYNNSVAVSAAHLSHANPALLTEFEKAAVGLSYQYESPLRIAWLADIGHRRVPRPYLQSAGFILPLRKLWLGLGFDQKFNSALVFEPLPITTPEYPEGTVEYYQIIDETTITSQSIILAVPLLLSPKRHRPTFGARFDINRLHHYETVWKFSYNTNISKNSWSYGLSYVVTGWQQREFKIGVVYNEGTAFRKLIHANIGINAEGEPQPTSFTVIGHLPPQISLGWSARIHPRITLLCDGTKLIWSRNRADYRDQWESAFTVLVSPTAASVVSLGIYQTDRRYKRVPSSNLFGYNGKFQTTYLTLSFGLKWKQFDLMITVADSHLLGGPWRKNTLGNTALVFRF